MIGASRIAAPIFDTLQLSKSLRSDFTAAQADALATALATSAHDTIATKADISDLRVIMKADLLELKAEMTDLKAATKSEIAELRAATRSDITEMRAMTKADLLELKVDLVRWIVTAIAFNFVATAGLFIGFGKLFAK